MGKRPKFKLTQFVRLTPVGKLLVRLTPVGKLLLKAGPFKDCPSEGDFLVLGEQHPVSGVCPQYYLIENVENPQHPALWVPEKWLEKA